MSTETETEQGDPEHGPLWAPLLPATSHEPMRPYRAPPQAEGGEAPTIHVSIGRVEVRAVQPPPKPHRRSERPAPKLSLDDYLKRYGRSE